MALTVSEAFEEFRSRLELNQTFQDKVTTHHNAIREWIESYDPSIETKLIGSLHRKTRIQPRPSRDRFDIDILVILGDFFQWVEPDRGISPKAALDKVEDVVSKNETYERMEPETDSPAIVMEYSDGIRVELVPAYRDQVGHASDGTPTLPKGRGYWIPQKGRWVIADYDYDADYVSNENTRTDKWLIPTIKILKSAKRNLFSDMKSYHLEAMATPIISTVVSHLKQGGELISYPRLVYYFFGCAADGISKLVKIPGSNSPPADRYMSSLRKAELAVLFNQLASACVKILAMADTAAIREWGRSFGTPFPSESEPSLESLLWTIARSRT
ncbi:MAG: hypothetical protein HY211_08345 [Candidatus Omnitrophica bacterium]|nr:hypothetical protein [Candidatus Omnitrophota bacterium]